MAPKPEDRYPSVDTFTKALIPFIGQTLVVKPDYERPGKGEVPPRAPPNPDGKSSERKIPVWVFW